MAMLGDILNKLTNAVSAEDILVTIGDPNIVARVRRNASAEGVTIGAFVAARVRHMLDYADDEVWLDLLGRMSGAPEPGAAALKVVLPRPFSQH
jgi:hypothetical protein